jgi:hypothetical protein
MSRTVSQKVEIFPTQKKRIYSDPLKHTVLGGSGRFSHTKKKDIY